jgi:uncharacterized protein involved in outer membrane biogenesis
MDLHDVNLNAVNPSLTATPNGPVAKGTINSATVMIGPVNFSDLEARLELTAKRIILDGLTLDCYGGSAKGNFSLTFGDSALAYTADTALKGVNVEQVLDAFPQMRGMMTGTMEGTARMQGPVLKSADPLEGARGFGTVNIRDGRMSTLQIAGNLRSLLQVANLGPANGDPASFTSLSTDFAVADGKLSSTKIDLEGNGLNVLGSGSLTTEGEGTLDYQAEAGVAAGSNALTAVLGSLAGGRIANGKLTVPFAVSGTFAKPRFSLQSSAGKPQETSPSNAEKNRQLIRGLGALFKKQKQD